MTSPPSPPRPARPGPPAPPDPPPPEPVDRTLPCGRPAAPLLEQVAEGRRDVLDEHQLVCPHCQAALGEFERLWSPVRAVAADRPTAPLSVVETALRRVRGDGDVEYRRIESSRGHTRVAARVVVAIARKLAAEVPGVEVALGGLDSSGAATVPDVDAGVSGGSTAVRITLAAAHGQDLPALAERIREAVAVGVWDATGLFPVAVSVHIDDVFL